MPGETSTAQAVAAVGLVLLLATSSGPASAQPNTPAPIDIESLFTPSGWMGDGAYGRTYVELSGADRTAPHSPPTAIRIAYTFGPNRWAGIYWQNKPDNWGDRPGNNYSGRGFSKLSFWAKGTTGRERVEFKIGAIDNPNKQHRDSLGETAGRVTLSREWQKYTIDLSKSDLTSVIGGFCWIASQDLNEATRIVFYLDDIWLE